MLLLSVALSTACTGQGSDLVTPTEATTRLDDLRQALGLQAAPLDPTLTQAAQDHADYMQRHDVLTHQQQPGDAGFTGEWVWDRAEAAGGGLEPFTMMSEVVAWGHDGEQVTDFWMDSVYHRLPLVAPELQAVGSGQAGDYAAMALVAAFPNSEPGLVVVPHDGQTGVPVDFDSDTEVPDPAPAHGVVGYPVTVSVAATTDDGPDANPFEIEVLEARLEGPDGLVPSLLLAPGGDGALNTEVALLPAEPLLSGAEYTATFELAWADGQERVTSSFTTR